MFELSEKESTSLYYTDNIIEFTNIIFSEWNLIFRLRKYSKYLKNIKIQKSFDDFHTHLSVFPSINFNFTHSIKPFSLKITLNHKKKREKVIRKSPETNLPRTVDLERIVKSATRHHHGNLKSHQSRVGSYKSYTRSPYFGLSACLFM